MTRAIVVVATCALWASTGCNNSGATTASSLSGLQASGALVGQKGKLRITFAGPVDSDTQIQLVSSAPSIANVASQVTIPKGAAALDVPYDGVTVGTTGFTATAGGITQVTSGTVVTSLQIGYFYDANRLEVGASDNTSLYLNASPSDPVTLTIVTADPTIATVPTMVTVAPFETSALVFVTALKAGSTQMTATLGSSSLTANVNVIDKAVFVEGSAYSSQVEVGATVRLSAYLNAISASDHTVTVTSSDTTVGASPAPIVIPAGSTSAYGSFQALGAGTTTLAFSDGGYSTTTPVSVVAQASLSPLSGTASIAAGGTGSLGISFNAVLANARTVTITSSNPAVVTLPPTDTIGADDTSDSIYFEGLQPGAATITVTSNGQSQTFDVLVTAQGGGINYAGGGGTYVTGAVSNIYVDTFGPATLTLTSSNPSVVTVPATLTTTGYINFSLPVLAPGTANVTITAPDGSSRVVEFTVVASAEITYLPAYTTVAPGQIGQLYFDLNAGTAGPTTITLTSSDTSIVSVPPSVTVPAGGSSGSFNVTGGTSGSAIVVLTLNGVAHPTVVYVASPAGAFFGSLGVYGDTLQVGANTVAYIETTNADVTADTTFTITATPAGVVTVPSSATIGTGASEVFFPITAVAAGSAVIKVVGLGAGHTITITVVAQPTFGWQTPTTMTSGNLGQSFYIYSDCALAADTTFTLASTNTGAVTFSPPTVTLPAGNSAFQAYYSLQPVAPGSSTVTATSGGTTLTTTITVN